MRPSPDFVEMAKTPLPMPMLVLAGETTSGNGVAQAKSVATQVDGVVVPGSGHWLMEEATAQVVPKLVSLLAD